MDMKPRSCLLLSAIVLSAFLAACSPSDVRRTIRDVSTYIQERPDSALSVLEEIDTLRLGSRGIRAAYGLLYAMALDKNDRDDGSFLSGAQAVWKYYRYHGAPEKKELSAYYYADQLKDAGDDLAAVPRFMETYQLAMRRGDDFYAGMACRELAEIFYATHDYPDQVKYSELACHFFRKAGKDLHAAFALYEAQCGRYNLQDYAGSLRTADTVISMARSLCDTNLLTQSLSSSVLAFSLRTPPSLDSAMLRLKEIRALRGSYTPEEYADLALISTKMDRNSPVSQLLDSAYRSVSSRRQFNYVFASDYEVTKLKGDSLRAYRMMDQILDSLFRQVRETIKQSAVRTMASYTELQLAQEQQRIRRSRTVAWFAGVAVIVALFFLIRRVRRFLSERKQWEQEKSDYHLLIDELNRASKTQIGAAFKVGARSFERLCDAYYTSSGKNNRMLISAFLQSIADFYEDPSFHAEFEAYVDASRQSILSHLRAEIPDLSESDFSLFVLSASGLSTPSICSILHVDRPVFYTRLSRLRRKIKESSSIHHNDFLSILDRNER